MMMKKKIKGGSLLFKRDFPQRSFLHVQQGIIHKILNVRFCNAHLYSSTNEPHFMAKYDQDTVYILN